MPRTRRRGTAPLEFVLVLPLLLAITVAGWWCARAGLTKVGAASDARREAWDKRADADPGVPFDLRQRPLLSAVEAEVETPVPGNNPFAGGTVRARSFALMVDKTWDHEHAEFPRLPDAPIAVHRDRLMHFRRFIAFIGVHGHKVRGFADMDLPANGRFARHAPRAERDRAARRGTTRTFALGPAAMAAAIAECLVLAAEAPPVTTAIYLPLAAVIAQGVIPSVELVPETVK